MTLYKKNYFSIKVNEFTIELSFVINLLATIFR